MSDSVLDFGVRGLAPSTVGGTGTTVKYFPRPYGPSIGVAPLTPSTVNPTGALFIPSAGVFNGQQIPVLVSGSVGPGVADPSSAATVQLYVVTGSLTAPVYTSVATTGSITDNYNAIPFGFNVTLLGDSLSGLLVGQYTVYQAGAITAPTTLTTNVAGINFNGDGTGLNGAGNQGLGKGIAFGLVVGATFTTSNATNLATLTQFQIGS
jgi:hypothetical protein